MISRAAWILLAACTAAWAQHPIDCWIATPPDRAEAVFAPWAGPSLQDYSGRGNHLTLNGTVLWREDGVGTSYEFFGTNGNYLAWGTEHWTAEDLTNATIFVGTRMNSLIGGHVLSLEDVARFASLIYSDGGYRADYHNGISSGDWYDYKLTVGDWWAGSLSWDGSKIGFVKNGRVAPDSTSVTPAIGKWGGRQQNIGAQRTGATILVGNVASVLIVARRAPNEEVMKWFQIWKSQGH